MKKFKRLRCLAANLVRFHFNPSKPAYLPDISPYKVDDFDKIVKELLGSDDSTIQTTGLLRDRTKGASNLFNEMT
jgi:hypothetical protein